MQLYPTEPTIIATSVVWVNLVVMEPALAWTCGYIILNYSSTSIIIVITVTIIDKLSFRISIVTCGVYSTTQTATNLRASTSYTYSGCCWLQRAHLSPSSYVRKLGCWYKASILLLAVWLHVLYEIKCPFSAVIHARNVPLLIKWLHEMTWLLLHTTQPENNEPMGEKQARG